MTYYDSDEYSEEYWRDEGDHYSDGESYYNDEDEDDNEDEGEDDDYEPESAEPVEAIAPQNVVKTPLYTVPASQDIGSPFFFRPNQDAFEPALLSTQPAFTLSKDFQFGQPLGTSAPKEGSDKSRAQTSSLTSTNQNSSGNVGAEPAFSTITSEPNSTTNTSTPPCNTLLNSIDFDKPFVPPVNSAPFTFSASRNTTTSQEKPSTDTENPFAKLFTPERLAKINGGTSFSFSLERSPHPPVITAPADNDSSKSSRVGAKRERHEHSPFSHLFSHNKAPAPTSTSPATRSTPSPSSLFNIHTVGSYLKSTKNCPVLARACIVNNVYVVENMLKNPVSAIVNEVHLETGLTPLLYAVGNGHLQIVRLLCEAGANLFYTVNNLNALRLASFYNYIDICQVLVQHVSYYSKLDSFAKLPRQSDVNVQTEAQDHHTLDTAGRIEELLSALTLAVSSPLDGIASVQDNISQLRVHEEEALRSDAELNGSSVSHHDIPSLQAQKYEVLSKYNDVIAEAKAIRSTLNDSRAFLTPMWKTLKDVIEKVESISSETVNAHTAAIDVVLERVQGKVQRQQDAFQILDQIMSLLDDLHEEETKLNHMELALVERRALMSKSQRLDAHRLFAAQQSLCTDKKNSIEECCKKLETMGATLQMQLATQLIRERLGEAEVDNNDDLAMLRKWLSSQKIFIQAELKRQYTDDIRVMKSTPLGIKTLVCTRRRDNEEVLVKMYPVHDGGELVQSQLRSELLTLLRFQHNPNIVHLNCIFEDNGYIACEMPFMRTLDLWLKDQQYDSTNLQVDIMTWPSKQSPEHILHVLNQMVEVVAQLHSQKMEHGGLSLQSFLVEGDLTVRLWNLEMVKDWGDVFLSDVNPKASISSGTPPVYLAPEFKTPSPHTSKPLQGDIYSLGVVLYACLAGTQDISRIELLHTGAAKHDDILKESGNFNGWRRHLILQLLHTDPAERPNAISLEYQWKNLDLTERATLKSQAMDSQTKIDLLKVSFADLKSKHSIGSFKFKDVDVNHVDEKVLHHMKTVSHLGPLLREWSVSFKNQSGVDGGGLIRFFHQCAMRKLLSTEYFQVSEGNRCTPRDDRLLVEQMHGIGKYFARCLLTSVPLAWHFSLFMFSFLVQKEPTTLEDLLSCVREEDAQFALSMYKVLQNPREMYGITIAEGKEREFVMNKLTKKLHGEECAMKNLEALREGFYSCLGVQVRNQVQTLSGEELKQIMLDSLNKVDRNAVIRTLKASLNKDSRWNQAQNRVTKQWFLNWLSTCNESYISKLLTLMTGWSGFNEKMTTPLTVSPSSNTRGHSCFSNMELSTTCATQKLFADHLEFVLNETETSAFDD